MNKSWGKWLFILNFLIGSGIWIALAVNLLKGGDGLGDEVFRIIAVVFGLWWVFPTGLAFLAMKSTSLFSPRADLILFVIMDLAPPFSIFAGKAGWLDFIFL